MHIKILNPFFGRRVSGLLGSLPTLVLAACSSAAFLPPEDAAPEPTPGGPAELSELELTDPNENELVFSGVQGTQSRAQQITLRNVGDAPLVLDTFNLSGPGAAAFRLEAPSVPLSVPPGGAVGAAITFAPSTAGSVSAQLTVSGSDAQTLSLSLYGLGSLGEQGENEPPLAEVVQTLGYTVDVGSTELSLGDGGAPVGDEVLAPLFRRAGPGPVTLEVVARYGPEEGFPYGFFYLDAAQPVTQEVGVVGASEAQKLLPARLSGEATFDPGAATFGIYGQAGGETQYSLDGLNTGEVAHALRIYPAKDRAGNPVPNSYLIGLEEAGGGDYQDAVFILSNVRPASVTVPSADALGGWESLFNGTDLSGWYSYLPSQGVDRDPEGVFRVENGTIHVLGVEDKGTREFGYLATRKSYRNYQLRLEYRWGERRFAPRHNKKRDSGVIYHMTGRDRVWPQGVEYQIQEGDTGDFWLLDGTTLTTTVESPKPAEPRYEQNGLPYTSRGGDFVRIIKSGTFEHKREWNTVDIIVRGDTATHLINGQVNNRAYSLHTPSGAPLTEGKILLQAEGAEVFYRNIQIRPLEGP